MSQYHQSQELLNHQTLENPNFYSKQLPHKYFWIQAAIFGFLTSKHSQAFFGFVIIFSLKEKGLGTAKLILILLIKNHSVPPMT